MPELPEVETVRRGLAAAITGQVLAEPAVLHPRTTRRQPGGATAFLARSPSHPVSRVRRRGKYLWLEFAERDAALVAHLGMSGQFRLAPAADHPHARTHWRLADGTRLVFADQRTFGWLLVDDLTEVGIPTAVAHVAPDPFDPAFDMGSVAGLLAGSRSGIKRAILDQRKVSGIGNIYADEALWRSRVHPETPGERLGPEGCEAVLVAARDVMAEALVAGGTSFDPLYVSVNGDSGWFERSLAVYGRQGHPCPRCGTAVVRERFTNRSSHRCPKCQVPWHTGGGSSPGGLSTKGFSDGQGPLRTRLSRRHTAGTGSG